MTRPDIACRQCGKPKSDIVHQAGSYDADHPFAMPPAPAAGEDEALLKKMREAKASVLPYGLIGASDVIGESASRLRALLADVAWLEKIVDIGRSDHWVDACATAIEQRDAALARAEAAEEMIHEFDRRCEAGNCEKCSAIAAWLLARAAGDESAQVQWDG